MANSFLYMILEGLFGLNMQSLLRETSVNLLKRKQKEKGKIQVLQEMNLRN